jgi:hypothetical protein
MRRAICYSRESPFLSGHKAITIGPDFDSNEPFSRLQTTLSSSIFGMNSDRVENQKKFPTRNRNKVCPRSIRYS